jgi:Dyp-type peroxidase family
MFSTKWLDDYKSIKDAQKTITQSAGAPFDIAELGEDNWRRRLQRWATAKGFDIVFPLLRAFWPVAHIGQIYIVSRSSDVSNVLKRSDVFEVPYGLEMKELAGGKNFVLGLDGDEHDKQEALILGVIDRVKDPDRVASISREHALALIRASRGRINVMKDLITRVASETAREYFGIEADDPDAFAEWSLPISNLLFADPFGDPKSRQLALNAAIRIRAVIDRSIGHQRNAPQNDTLLSRLLAVPAGKREEHEALVRTVLVGLTTGLIPTNTLAAGKILQQLLRDRKAYGQAVKAAAAAEQFEGSGSTGPNPHKQRLQSILFEAARLNPALAPGQFRRVVQDTTISASNGKTVHIPKNSVLLVSTMSALHDPRAIDHPNRFNPDRKPSDIDPMFGLGPHDCLGRHLAMRQITEIFQVLLSQRDLRLAKGRAGRLSWIGPFPQSLEMEFNAGAHSAVQEMLTICAPLKKEAKREEVEAQILALDKTRMHKALTRTKLVHFASLHVVELGDAGNPHPYLIFELNVDGTRQEAIQRVVKYAQAYLRPIFDQTPLGGTDLVRTFEAYAVDLQTYPFGAIGLNFNGTSEFAVTDIARQQKLARFARRAVSFVMERDGVGARAMPIVKYVRGLIRQEQRYIDLANDATDPREAAKIRSLLAEGAQFEDMLMLPSGRRLNLTSWVDRTKEEAFTHFFKSADFWRPAGSFLVLAAVFAVLICIAFGVAEWFGWPGQILISLTGGLAASLLLALALLAVFVILLRYHERTDVPDDRPPELAHMHAINARENMPGVAQNHFISVSQLKSGLFRKLTLAVSLWGIKQLIQHSYRPGFILNIGTIHYAKWFRLPGTEKLIFLANYDGSWESYLEDFITKAHAGQTAAWSNGLGFPKTSLLINEGAQDGDRFKRWVRRQQRPRQYWFSRFSKLTAAEIRNNAVIHHGLASATSDSAARSWLSCFGSMQRPDHAIEHEQVQSIVFRGFPRSPHAAYAIVKLPDDAERCAKWLDALVPQSKVPTGQREAKSAASRVTFGQDPFRLQPELDGVWTFVAFSASGLKKLGLPENGNGGGLATFDSAFTIGMANRGGILGDPPKDPPWRWSDAPRQDYAAKDGAATAVADAIIIVYGPTLGQCTGPLAAHEDLLGAGSLVVDTVKSSPLPTDEPFVFTEHFGFRDGLSQPVIRGTQRLLKGDVDERDIVEPGEFILGYRNNQGYYPPAITVGIETDLNDQLPDVIASSPPPFPSFRTPASQQRDFGRNGTFLVVRQIEQHVKEFNKFTEDAATRLLDSKLSQIAGAPVTKDWVAAKMMGRWRSGVPLALSPVEDDKKDAKKLAETSFAYAADDPQGFRCPFGAHIRRANPRDGLQINDDTQQSITNRHRLLRRGRVYEDDRGQEKGIMFACVCTDLERQFEFVQQTWIGSRSFHGLTGEVDPVIGNRNPEQKKAVFTIPTPTGPVTLDGLKRFVTVRAGGYFFLPSLPALLYLSDRCREKASLPPRPKPSIAGDHGLLDSVASFSYGAHTGPGP